MNDINFRKKKFFIKYRKENVIEGEQNGNQSQL